MKSAGVSSVIIMGRWSDDKFVFTCHVVKFIRPGLAMLMSGELLQFLITRVGASSFNVQNAESSICSAISIPRASVAMPECHKSWWALKSPKTSLLSPSRRGDMSRERTSSSSSSLRGNNGGTYTLYSSIVVAPDMEIPWHSTPGIRSISGRRLYGTFWCIRNATPPPRPDVRSLRMTL